MVNWMTFLLKNLQNEERGQGLVEYALMLVFIALVVVLAMMLIGPGIGETFTEVGSAMQ